MSQTSTLAGLDFSEVNMLNLLGKRYYFFALSLLIIIPGLVIWAIYGVPMAVDFKGGSML